MNINNIKSWAIFSPIRFYYSIFTGNKELREKELDNDRKLGNLIFVPLFIFFLSVIIALLFPNILTSVIVILSFCFTMANVIIIKFEKDSYNTRQRRERELREEQEWRERQRREYEQQKRYQEWVRQKREEEQRRMEDALRREHERLRRERERANREWSYEYSNYYSNRQGESIDQNMVNAKKLLGLKDNFTQSDVKSAYRKLSKVHHPDTKTGTEENFKRLNKAYNYIMDRI